MSNVLLYVLSHPFFMKGLLITAYLWWKDSKLLRVEWENVAKFCGFIALVMAIRFAILDYGFFSSALTNASGVVSFKHFMWVFWEDAFFALPIYYLKDHKKVAKKWWVTAAVILSLVFMVGHLYQGLLGIVSVIFPYGVFYHYGKKYGFGTTMVCHIVYDFTTLMTFKLFQLIKYLP